MCTVVNLLFSLASNRLVPTLLQTGKNHVRLIIAFDQLKLQENIPHQLILAGNDPDRADEVHQVAEKASCTKKIIFTEFVDTKDIPTWYNGADIFVFPSLHEGFGLPV